MRSSETSQNWYPKPPDVRNSAATINDRYEFNIKK